MIPRKCVLPLKARFIMALNPKVFCEGVKPRLLGDVMYSVGGGVNHTIYFEFKMKPCEKCPRHIRNEK
jgi:hypothetical protein